MQRTRSRRRSNTGPSKKTSHVSLGVTKVDHHQGKDTEAQVLTGMTNEVGAQAGTLRDRATIAQTDMLVGTTVVPVIELVPMVGTLIEVVLTGTMVVVTMTGTRLGIVTTTGATRGKGATEAEARVTTEAKEMMGVIVVINTRTGDTSHSQKLIREDQSIRRKLSRMQRMIAQDSGHQMRRKLCDAT